MKEKDLKVIQREAETLYSTYGSCPNHSEVVFEELEPRQFSFNSPFGACDECLGLGEKKSIDEDLVIPDKNLSIMDGAIAVYGKIDLTWRAKQLTAVGKAFGFDIFMPIKDYTKEQLKVLLYGTTKGIKANWHTGAAMKQLEDGFEGVIPQTERLYAQTDSDWRRREMEKFMTSRICPKCLGKRLKDNMLAVKIDEKSIIDVTDMSIGEAKEFFDNLKDKLNDKEKFIAKQVLKELNDRLTFLNDVGLSYLNLSRSAGTLSGGEAQRIRLATQIGANLMGVLYVLDEPSIGLHQRDNEKLIKTLHKLRDLGNTLIVVEHDEDTIAESDYVVDIGPGAGIKGGHISAIGTPKEIEKNDKSITGQYLSGKKKIEVPKKRREVFLD